MTSTAQSVVSQSGGFLPAPASGSCLLPYVCTSSCVTRLCQGKHWPQCKDQRNKQSRVELWDSSHKNEHEIGSLWYYMQGSYLNIDFQLWNPISTFYITCMIPYITFKKRLEGTYCFSMSPNQNSLASLYLRDLEFSKLVILGLNGHAEWSLT